MSVLLDAHIWVWWLTPGSPLSRAERNALDAKAERRELFLPAISLWEIQVLHAKRRFELEAMNAPTQENISPGHLRNWN